MASTANVAKSQEFAIDLGVRVVVDGRNGHFTKRFVKTFQSAYTFANLSVDGDPGPKTLAAMAECRNNGFKLSKNFTIQEIGITKGSKRVTRSNPVFLVERGLVESLQKLRNSIGRPIYIVSAFRDSDHNRVVGGAANSQHLYGRAVDIDRTKTPEITERQAWAAGFNGVGLLSRSQPGRNVCHVDVRASRTRWFYTE